MYFPAAGIYRRSGFKEQQQTLRRASTGSIAAHHGWCGRQSVLLYWQAIGVLNTQQIGKVNQGRSRLSFELLRP